MPKKLADFKDQIAGKQRVHLSAPQSSKVQFEQFITECRGRQDTVVTSKTGSRNGDQNAVLYTSNIRWVVQALLKVPGHHLWN